MRVSGYTMAALDDARELASRMGHAIEDDPVGESYDTLQRELDAIDSGGESDRRKATGRNKAYARHQRRLAGMP